MKADAKTPYPYPYVIDALNTYVWAILPEYLETIHAIMAERIFDGRPTTEDIQNRIESAGKNKDDKSDVYNVGDVRVIPINGVIAKRMNMFSRISGGVSSEMIKKEIGIALADDDIRGIVLDIDSPGGTTDGTFDLSDYIYSARGKKPIIAYGNGLMASAAYHIGSSADLVIANQSTQIGSIGVVTTHVDYSQAYSKAGVKKTYITAGKYKAVPNETEPLDTQAREYVQERLDHLYTLFVDAVARNRGVDAKTVLEKMADGKIFIGTQALKAGLIDEIGTFDDAISAVTAKQSGSLGSAEYNGVTSTLTQTNTYGQEETIMPITREQLEMEAPELVAQILKEGKSKFQTEHTEHIDDAKGEGVSAERTRVVKILEAGGNAEITLQAIKDGIPASETFEALFRAEKVKNTGILNDMADSATESVGAEKLKAPEKSDNRRPDEILAEKAQKYAAEKGVSYEEAEGKVMASNPKLAEALRRGLEE